MNPKSGAGGLTPNIQHKEECFQCLGHTICLEVPVLAAHTLCVISGKAGLGGFPLSVQGASVPKSGIYGRVKGFCSVTS